MYFEAESNDNKYQVKLVENRTQWRVSVKKNDGDWCDYDVSKEDFQNLDNTISFMFKGQSYLVDVLGGDTEYTVYTRGSHRSIKIFNDEMLLHESLKSGSQQRSGDNLTSGMPGKIIKIFVKEGDTFKKDDPLVIMEAMKMENEMRAGRDVKIKKIHVESGQNVETGSILISFEP